MDAELEKSVSERSKRRRNSSPPDDAPPGDRASTAALAERIFERLIRQREEALASVPFVPQTIMDLLEDAPEHPPPKPSMEDVAQARMEALRSAYDARRQNEAPQELFYVESWNIDGLDEEGHEELVSRLAGVVGQILEDQPAVVCLQEVVDPALHWLRKALDSRYEIITPTPKTHLYFVVMLVSRTQVAHVKGSRTVPFPASKMGRQLLVADVALHGGASATFITGHLESTKECAAERKAQLKIACELVSSETADLVAFAGDLNLRDAEAKPVLSKFPHIRCAWEHLGSDKGQEHTWDCSANDNCGIKGPRCRFDRLYFKEPGIAPAEFRLVGKERLPHGRFASDHWALLTRWPLPTAVVPRGETSAGEEAQKVAKVARHK
eukprot:CAMPEP_0117543436 /NCGR_PEP_ID=MMETSP0784-20121206/45061_1 /TAXON_ID=39447 /ORGANISM="" /LENGTH=381 /DNA_ID=CAMNT_0005340217 /DNA_START=76 /DNA_END=1221 /DNA_ORIENTATION=+